MDFRPLGALLTRPDANGNIGIFDTAGNERVQIIGGVISNKLNKSIGSLFTAISSTTSLTGVFTGASAVITPQVSSNILVIGRAFLSNNTAGDGAILSVNRTLGTIGINGGTAASGNVIGNQQILNNASTAGVIFPTDVVSVDSSAVPGTSYVYSLAVSAQTGGTVTITNASSDLSPGGSVIAIEL